MGPLVYFNTTGPQRMRIQTREDGLSIDQIVLSPVTYLNTAPGTQQERDEHPGQDPVAGIPAPIPAPYGTG